MGARKCQHARNVIATIVLPGLVATGFAPAAQCSPQSGVKAAMIYNIIRFISFSRNHDRLRLCSRANEVIAADLRGLTGRPIGDAQIDTVLVDSSSDFSQSCEIIYAGNLAPSDLPAIARNQVLIGEARNFVDQGGTIGLLNFGGQVRFAINSASARRARVRISAQLMQLSARTVSK